MAMMTSKPDDPLRPVALHAEESKQTSTIAALQNQMKAFVPMDLSTYTDSLCVQVD